MREFMCSAQGKHKRNVLSSTQLHFRKKERKEKTQVAPKENN